MREILDRVLLTPVPGDAWGRQTSPDPTAQRAVMQTNIAELIANGQSLTLSGDNLFLTIDLSKENLPTGSRLRIGSALLEVTPTPYDGCSKFRGHFGGGALRFASHPDLRHRNLRGIYLRVVEPGQVRPGDPVVVVSRGATTEVTRANLEPEITDLKFKRFEIRVPGPSIGRSSAG